MAADLPCLLSPLSENPHKGYKGRVGPQDKRLSRQITPLCRTVASRHAKRVRSWSGSWGQRPRNLLTPGSVANLGFDAGTLNGVGASGEAHHPNGNRGSPA